MLQDSFFTEYLWVATTNIVKYLKTLTITTYFLKFFRIFLSEQFENLEHNIVWESCFPEKMDLCMGKTFKIGFGESAKNVGFGCTLRSHSFSE